MATTDKRLWRIGPKRDGPLLTNTYLVTIESILLFLIIWSAGARLFDLAFLISTPSEVAVHFTELILSGNWIEHVSATLRRVAYAFVFSMVLGTVVGVAMGLSTTWKTLLQDYVTIFMTFPSLFAALFATMWFGVSDITPMVAAGMIIYAYVAQVIYQSVEDIDSNLYEMSAAFDLSRGRVYRRIVAQAIMGQWIASARYAFAVGLKLVTLTEIFAAQNGIGFMLTHWMGEVDLPMVYSWTLIATVIIIGIEYGVFQPIERHVFRWKPDADFGLV